MTGYENAAVELVLQWCRCGLVPIDLPRELRDRNRVALATENHVCSAAQKNYPSPVLRCSLDPENAAAKGWGFTMQT